ncbi:hypothetical protein RI367_003780 [Sorochytrium milnesiophthora]
MLYACICAAARRATVAHRALPASIARLAPGQTGWRHASTWSSTRSSSVHRVQQQQLQLAHRADSQRRAHEDERQQRTLAVYSDPYLLSSKIKALVEAEQIADAVDLLRHQRPSVQSTPAWNMILGHYSRLGRWNRTWSLYNDMKKVGCAPNERTYGYLFSALRTSSSEHRASLASELFANIPRELVSNYVVNNYIKLLSTVGKYDEMMRVYRKYPELHDPVTFSIVIYAATKQKDIEGGFAVWGDYIRWLEKLLARHGGRYDPGRTDGPEYLLDVPLFMALAGLCRQATKISQAVYPLHLLHRLLNLAPPDALVPTSVAMPPLALQNPSTMEVLTPKGLQELLLLCRAYEGKLRAHAFVNPLAVADTSDVPQVSYTLHYLLNFAQVVHPGSLSFHITESALLQSNNRALLQAYFRQMHAPHIPSLDGQVLVTNPRPTAHANDDHDVAADSMRHANNPVQWSPLYPPVRTRFYTLAPEATAAVRKAVTPENIHLEGHRPHRVTRDSLSMVACSLALPTQVERTLTGPQLRAYVDRLGEWVDYLVKTMFVVQQDQPLTYRQVHYLMRVCRRYMELRSHFPLPFSEKLAARPSAPQAQRDYIRLTHVSKSQVKTDAEADTEQYAPDDATPHTVGSSDYVLWYDRAADGQASSDLSDDARCGRWYSQHPATYLFTMLRLDDNNLPQQSWLQQFRNDVDSDESETIPSATVSEQRLASTHDMVESARLFVEAYRECGLVHQRHSVSTQLLRERLTHIDDWKFQQTKKLRDRGLPLVRRGFNDQLPSRTSSHPYYKFQRGEVTETYVDPRAEFRAEEDEAERLKRAAEMERQKRARAEAARERKRRLQEAQAAQRERRAQRPPWWDRRDRTRGAATHRDTAERMPGWTAASTVKSQGETKPTRKESPVILDMRQVKVVPQWKIKLADKLGKKAKLASRDRGQVKRT